MRTWKSALSLLLISTGLLAQEQMVLRVNEKGILKTMEMALRYNTATKKSRTIVVPQNIYKFTLPKKGLLTNPIVSVANEISDLNLNRDLDFYLNTSDIKVTGDVNVKSLKATIFNSVETGFDMRLSIELPRIEATGQRLSLCEDKARHTKSCGDGLKATVGTLKIQTKKRPVVITAVLRLRTDKGVARFKVMSVNSNLEGKYAPTLDVNFNSLTVPKIAIVINGQETELDTSRLKNEILERKALLGAKLIAFAADFITSDLVEMINVYLINKEVATTWTVYNQDMPKFDEFLSSGVHHTNYNRPQLKDPMGIFAQMAEVIQNARVDLELKKISTPMDKDIELAGMLNFVLNNRALQVRNTLGNSQRPLPTLDLSQYRNNDVNMAISEPLLNGALDLVNSTGLFQEFLRQTADIKGVSLKNVKMHFKSSNAIAIIVNASIDLKKLHSESASQWIKNWIAAWLERNNNDAVIYFPIEIDVIPQFEKKTDGSVGMKIYVRSPFGRDGLLNSFGYPSNVNAMKDIVRKTVMEELQIGLQDFTNRFYSVDVTKFLNQAGVVFGPKMISVNQGAYLLLGLDIIDIKFDSKNPNKR